MACRHLGLFFEVSIEYNLDQIDFTLKALKSEYKKGIEIYQPQWYSQSQYYYFEEFLEDNNVKEKLYKEDEITYEKEVMYWLGYCLQEWSNNTNKSGAELAKLLDENGIEHLIRNYKIYHTVSPMYVLEDAEECLSIQIN